MASIINCQCCPLIRSLTTWPKPIDDLGVLTAQPDPNIALVHRVSIRARLYRKFAKISHTFSPRIVSLSCVRLAAGWVGSDLSAEVQFKWRFFHNLIWNNSGWNWQLFAKCLIIFTIKWQLDFCLDIKVSFLTSKQTRNAMNSYNCIFSIFDFMYGFCYHIFGSCILDNKVTKASFNIQSNFKVQLRLKKPPWNIKINRVRVSLQV